MYLLRIVETNTTCHSQFNIRFNQVHTCWKTFTFVMVQLNRSTNVMQHQYDCNNRIQNKYSYDTTAICTIVDTSPEQISIINTNSNLLGPNVNQTEPLRFLVPSYKHPTRVMVCLLKIIIIRHKQCVPCKHRLQPQWLFSCLFAMFQLLRLYIAIL